jgi:dihydroorotase-like cyclic amidohydrolase
VGYTAIFEQNPRAVFQATPDPIIGEDEIWRSLNDGTISLIATDHSPHTREDVAKARVDPFHSVTNSIPSLEHMLSLYLTEVNTQGRITLHRIVQLLSVNVAKELGIYPRKGTIQIGSDADLTLIDMTKEDSIDPDKMFSKCGHTPFAGRKIKGMPVTTIVRGTPVMENREIVGTPGYGKFIPRSCKDEP